MRIDELRHHALMESMGFSPVALQKTDQYPNGIWDSVFPDKWTSEFDRDNMDMKRFYMDFDYEPPANPDYRPELNINLSNSNMRYVMEEVLGLGEYFDSELYGYNIPIQDFLTKAQSWLQGNVGQTTPKVDPHEHPRQFKRTVTTDPETGVQFISGGYQGARMIDMGRREGYDEETVMRMVKVAQMGQQLGATHVTAH